MSPLGKGFRESNEPLSASMVIQRSPVVVNRESSPAKPSKQQPKIRYEISDLQMEGPSGLRIKLHKSVGDSYPENSSKCAFPQSDLSLKSSNNKENLLDNDRSVKKRQLNLEQRRRLNTKKQKILFKKTQ